ncbi:MAG: hypothetical protein IT440_09320 [Phycisphaeraceae bacterium]|nr:hypothetical protein [Phycisphaeraceae bacterium]
MSVHANKPGDVVTTLLMMRMLWAALLSGQVIFLVVIVVLWILGKAPENAALSRSVFYVGGVLLVLASALGPMIRNQIYKANWRGDAVLPKGYITGNIVFLAMFEAASFVGLLAVMLSGRFSYPLAVPVLALAVQVINFPTGRVMMSEQLAPMTKRD